MGGREGEEGRQTLPSCTNPSLTHSCASFVAACSHFDFRDLPLPKLPFLYLRTRLCPFITYDSSKSQLPVLFGFFVPYKLASLRPAFVSLPPLRADEVRVFRYAGEPRGEYQEGVMLQD